MSFGAGAGVNFFATGAGSGVKKVTPIRLWLLPWKLAGLMTPQENVSYRNSFAKFNVWKEKVCWIQSGRNFFSHTGKYTINFRQVFIQFQASFFVTNLFEISQDIQIMVAHFTIWQYCCWIFQCLVYKCFTLFHLMPFICNYPAFRSTCNAQFHPLNSLIVVQCQFVTW